MTGSKEKTDLFPKMISAKGESIRHSKKMFHLANIFTVLLSKNSNTRYRSMAVLWMINNSTVHTVVLYIHYYSFILQKNTEDIIKYLALTELGTVLYNDR